MPDCSIACDSIGSVNHGDFVAVSYDGMDIIERYHIMHVIKDTTNANVTISFNLQ